MAGIAAAGEQIKQALLAATALGSSSLGGGNSSSIKSASVSREPSGAAANLNGRDTVEYAGPEAAGASPADSSYPSPGPDPRSSSNPGYDPNSHSAGAAPPPHAPGPNMAYDYAAYHQAMAAGHHYGSYDPYGHPPSHAPQMPHDPYSSTSNGPGHHPVAGHPPHPGHPHGPHPGSSHPVAHPGHPYDYSSHGHHGHYPPPSHQGMDPYASSHAPPSALVNHHQA